VYCLTHDLTTSISAGKAIDIQTNNVTIDCNGYKIGGLAAGTSSTAVGINANNTRLNLVVRNCGIRGYQYGILFGGGAGHLIEDNRLDNNLSVGIRVAGENSRVQRNRVYDTGGFVGANNAIGIYVNADVIDNTVDGVFTNAGANFPYGIVMEGAGTDARGNLVRGLLTQSGGITIGIQVQANDVTLDGNRVSLPSSLPAEATWGLHGSGTSANGTFCAGNTVANFNNPLFNCQDAGGNSSH
jgi:hypothetical protein